MKNSIASAVAAKKMECMLEPLLEYDDSESEFESDMQSSDISTVETIKQSPTQILKSLVVYLIIGAGIAASAAAIVYAPMLVTYVMGGICIANAPFSIIKEKQLGKAPTLRSMNNKLREDANNLTVQVDILSQEIDLLKPEADRAAAVEEELRAIAEKQAFNVNRLVDLVKQNESILAEMKFNLRQRICQDIITIVMKSDKNNDQTISKGEARLLVLRIRLQLHEYGVQVDSDKLVRFIEKNPSVVGLIEIAQKLLHLNDESASDETDNDTLSDMNDMKSVFFVAKDNLTKSATGEKSSPRNIDGNQFNSCEFVSLI